MITLKELQFSELQVADPNAEYSGSQTVFLDFDGAGGVSYDNDALDIHTNISSIADSGLSQEDQFKILTDLNNTYAGTGITFTITVPVSGEYSTIYVGGDGSEFSEYGNFDGLAETIDVGNVINDDDAFVFSDNLSSVDAITETIVHEVAHLVGYVHEGDTVIDELSDFATVDTLPLGTIKFTATDGLAYDYFGSDVAIAGAGATIIVGAYADDGTIEDEGSVYAYRWNGSSYDDAIKIGAGDADEDWFGIAVDGYGDAIISGANWGDGGGGGIDDTGAAYVYVWNGSSYTETKVVAADGEAYDYFGDSVAMSAEAMVVGASGDDNATGSVYVYHWDGDSYDYQSKIIAESGATGDYFGYTVDVSGYNVAVGSYDNVADATGAYVYRWNGLDTYTEHKLTVPGDVACYSYGNSIAIDGGVVAVGARCEDGGNGSYSGDVYVYHWNGVDAYDQEVILKASDANAYEFFGKSVAVDGDYIAVGAYGDTDNGIAAGAIYAYNWNGVSYDEYKIIAEAGEDDYALDFFGESVAIDGDYIVVGASGDNEAGYNGGSAYSINFTQIIEYSARPDTPTGDFDGNNKSDILWQNTTNDNIYTWIDGDGDINGGADAGFVTSLGDSTGYTFLDSGDFNGNGKSDILWSKDLDDSISTWNDGDDASNTQLGDSTGYTFLGTGDFSNDKISDVLWEDGDGDLQVWDDGAFANETLISTIPAYTYLGIGDFNADFESDILWENGTDVLAWDSANSATSHSLGTAALDYTYLGIGDFDGNMKSDILWQDGFGFVHSWTDGDDANDTVMGFANGSYDFIGIGDLDGNRKSDILWQDTSGNVYAWDGGEGGWDNILGNASSGYGVLSNIA
jgi:FG-GAP repeat